jgi:hypothetical protein
VMRRISVRIRKVLSLQSIMRKFELGPASDV